MKRSTIAGGAIAIVLVLVAVDAGRRALERDAAATPAPPSTTRGPSPSAAVPVPGNEAETEAQSELPAGFLYGRVTTDEGATHEGRLRWGGGEEAFWTDYFNGEKDANPWVVHVPPDLLPTERSSIEIFGLEIARQERPRNLDRLFMARFGDLARVDAAGREVRVTLKSGTVFVLDRLEASDFDDGVRVWDGGRGVVDLGPRRIRTIELLPTAGLGAAPERLHGTVRTRQGEFTGFVQWDREECVGTDELDGRAAEDELALRFDTIRSIERADDSSRVTLLDGSEVALSGKRDVGDGNRGIYVDDQRYGRVLVSWDAFERVDFSPPGQAGSGPAYGDFPPGRPLTGSVTTRAGRRLAGRLVYDLDESETTETLDAPFEGVDYTLPFGGIASIVVPGRGESGAAHARVTLQSGEELRLELAGDLGDRNAGLLVFVDGGERPEYVAWSDIERIDFDPPPATDPPRGGR